MQTEMVGSSQTAKGLRVQDHCHHFPENISGEISQKTEEECNRIIMHEAMISTVSYSAGKSLPEAVMPELRLRRGSLRNQAQSLKPSFYNRVISIDSILNLLPPFLNN